MIETVAVVRIGFGPGGAWLYIFAGTAAHFGFTTGVPFLVHLIEPALTLIRAG